MKRTNSMLLTTVVLSIALVSLFTFDFKNSDATTLSSTLGLPLVDATSSGSTHTISMEAVKMPDGMYAYRMVSYDLDGTDLVKQGVYDTDPQIPGPTLVFNELDSVQVTLTNNACADNFQLGGTTTFENSQVGIHVHGVHYDISDDATYARMNMSGESSSATCGKDIVYNWEVGLGTHGTWPYHDHTFSENEVGAEDLGLFGTVIVNPHNGKIDGIVDAGEGNIKKVNVDDIDKEFVLWMVSSEVLGRSIFYGMEIDNNYETKIDGENVTIPRQTALWVNPPLYVEEGMKVRYHVLGLGDETHAFHLHGHRWVDTTGGAADIIDVKEITPLQRHTFVVEVSDNGFAKDTTEGWMYHCHVFSHMQEGMSGMMVVVDDATLPDVGAVFTLSDEPGLWMKTLNAGIADDLDEVLEKFGVIPDGTARAGTGFPLDYLGTAINPIIDTKYAESEGRSLAIIHPDETVLFNMKDSQTKHTITALIFPEDAQPSAGNVGGNGKLSQLDLGLFDTQLGIRGSSFLTDGTGTPLKLSQEGLYVFVCKIHPYMFSAVIVDDPDTNVKTAVEKDGEILFLPLLDLSDSLRIMARTGAVDSPTFPTDVPPTHALAKELLLDYFVITDPSNWKDYTNGPFTISVPPVLVTSNVDAEPDKEDLVVLLNSNDTDLGILATALGATKSDGSEIGTTLGLGLDKSFTVSPNSVLPPTPGVGEIWINTQFETSVNKNHAGTATDKPGTITVVDASDWSIKKKIALPEINMNHPHNMWTDTKNEVIYQTQWFGTDMAVIDRESSEMIKNNFVGQSPSHVMTNPTNDKIYIAMNGEEQVAELDPNTFEITKQISTGPKSHPHGHWISHDGKYMVTPDFIGLTSTIINLETGDSQKPVGDHGGLFDGTPILLGPIATGMMSGDDKYYTADFLGNTVSVIDISENKIIKQIDFTDPAIGAGLPIQTPVSPDDKWVVTAHVLGPKITIIDTTSNEIVLTLDCDPGCHGVQWGAKDHVDGGYYAYVSNKFSNALIVFDPQDAIDADIAGNNNKILDENEPNGVVGRIILNEAFDTESDDKITGYYGMGGQGVLTIPNVYPGWIGATMTECVPDGITFVEDPCSEELVGYLDELTLSQRDP